MGRGVGVEAMGKWGAGVAGGGQFVPDPDRIGRREEGEERLGGSGGVGGLGAVGP